MLELTPSFLLMLCMTLDVILYGVNWLWPSTSLKSPAFEANLTDCLPWDCCSACVGLRYLPAGLLQLGFCWSIQGTNNAATTNTERRRQTNQVVWSISSTIRDLHWLPVKYQMTYNRCLMMHGSQQSLMSWIHRRAAHHDVFCYFILQTAIGFQQ